jgi:hypothetical protein
MNPSENPQTNNGVALPGVVPKVRKLSGGGIDVRLNIGTDELASLPRCVYEVTRDYLSGDFTEVGRESMSMIVLVLADLLPDDNSMITALDISDADDPQ